MATNRIFTAAKEYLSNFQLKIPRTAPKLSKASIKWRPPLGELYKTNYDGAVFSESGEAGIGVVVQDAKGEVIAALAEKITYPGSVVLLEALATRRAAKFIVELGISLFEFEGDLEVVYRALRTTDWSHPSFGQIIKDIVGLLRTFSFSHTRQQGNCVVHALAKRAIVFFPLLVWMEHVPFNVKQFVILDSATT